MKHLPFVSTLAGAAALLASSALAQPTPPSGPAPLSGPAPSQASPSAPPPGGFRGGGRKRIEELRAALKLRPDQETALRTYLEALRPDPAMRERMRAQREAMAGMTLEQRAAARAADNPDLAAMHQRRQEATRGFMAALTPEQRQAFHTFQRERRPSGGGFGGPGGPGGGPGGGPDGPGAPPPEARSPGA